MTTKMDSSSGYVRRRGEAACSLFRRVATNRPTTSSSKLTQRLDHHFIPTPSGDLLFIWNEDNFILC
jgi:hypothetical protein